MRIGCGLLAAGLLGGICQATSWYPLGPFGGDARSLAADPADAKHLFLGTATGWVYDSHDGGVTWTRVSQIANRNDLVIDHIVVDKENPKRLVIGAWTVDHPGDGGLFISQDYGKNWYSQAEMRGQAVLSLARAASDPKQLIAGTLKGVYRSVDNGVHWQQISPEGSSEIHEVQSIAIDPADPNVIYAGTWHLPWKTTDGGATWHNIKEGVIDDSDVFSIIVDPKQPNIVYASACSGIYKSADGGDLFHKVQGIPSTARRTRKLEQDPEHLETVFAGTTEGLYRTLDSGAQWERITPADVIVNDVYVDPTNSNHVLMATDRGGVYRSEDGGSTFETSNSGFSARQVTAFASDPQHLDTLYVGVVNDKATGGVFQSRDGAVHWQQQSDGLGGRDVFSLLALGDGTLLAGTGHGFFRQTDGGNWTDSSLFEPGGAVEKTTAPVKPAPHPHHGAQTSSNAPRHPGRAVAVAAHTRPGIQARRKASSSGTARRGTRAERASAKGRSATGSHGATLMRVSAVRGGSPQATKAPHPTEAAAVHTAKADRVDAEIYNIALSGDVLYAASGAGLLRSGDGGQHWAVISTLNLPDLHFIALQPASGSDAGGAKIVAADAPAAPAVSTAASPDAAAGAAPSTTPDTAAGAVPAVATTPTSADASGTPTLLAAGLKQLLASPDGGTTWNPVALPPELTQIGAICVDGEKNLWVGGREGVWFSPDGGATWKTLRNLFLTQVDSIFYDSAQRRVLVTSFTSPAAFSVQLPDDKVTYWDTGWKLRFVRPVGGHLVGATLFDGIVVQPEMVDSPVSTATAQK